MRYLLSNGQYVGEGQPFTFEGNQYPSNWLNLATEEEKESIGAVPVLAINERADDRFYTVTEKVNGAEIVYENIPKDLNVLKANEVKNISATAYSILQPSDYINTNNLRDPLYKPEWMAWRESVLNTSRIAVSQVNACQTVDELSAICAIEWPLSPDQIAIQSINTQSA